MIEVRDKVIEQARKFFFDAIISVEVLDLFQDVVRATQEGDPNTLTPRASA